MWLFSSKTSEISSSSPLNIASFPLHNPICFRWISLAEARHDRSSTEHHVRARPRKGPSKRGLTFWLHAMVRLRGEAGQMPHRR